MLIELHCAHCGTSFSLDRHTDAGIVWEQLHEQGPWFALGDGETVEDRIFAQLRTQDVSRCPDCDLPSELSEETVGKLSQQLLANW